MHNKIGVVAFLLFVLIIGLTGVMCADTGVNATPEVQLLETTTSASVIGTLIETDAGVWTITNDPFVLNIYIPGPIHSPQNYGAVVTWDMLYAQLVAAGGSAVYTDDGHVIRVYQLNVPESLLNTPIPAISDVPHSETWQQFLNANHFILSDTSSNGIHDGVLDPGQVQYTTAYNDAYSGISGQQTFVKSMAVSTANKIAGQSNLETNTNIQFIAVDAGRATRSEDLMVNGAAQALDATEKILCPFINTNQAIIPAFSNIVQAGSSFDTSLASTVTSANTRFVGSDANIPVALNYDINSKGLMFGDRSSPMLGSVSAYLKVHVQEARNESIVSGKNNFGFYSFPDTMNPPKTEDLVYSETSSASGSISRFSKSMSYLSQASAVTPPVQMVPTLPEEP